MPSTSNEEAILRQAMGEHGAGHFDAAEALYRELLAHNPEQADALHLYGVLHAQRGRLVEAANAIARAVEIKPREAMFRNNLGNVRVEQGRLDDAEALYLQAFELDGSRLDALNNLGVLLGRRGRGDDAEKVLLRVVELAPQFADARQNLANHYLRCGRLADAARECVDGLIVAPRSTAMRRLLGIAYSTMGMRDEAIKVYRAWLEVDPDNPVPAHHLRACTGEGVPERAADAYVTRVFDAFASSFEAKLADLSYRAPELVAQRVAQTVGAPTKSLAVLDAGCGTGLCGPGLAPYASTLTGVDLSEGMLQKALARRLYDELVAGELVAFLQSRQAAWDLIASADTLCYFGRLDGFAAAAAQAMRAGGVLVFTVEAHADDSPGATGAPDYRLHEHGRYSHRRRYVETCLRDAGFGAVDSQPAVLRMEAGQPVEGWVIGARLVS